MTPPHLAGCNGCGRPPVFVTAMTGRHAVTLEHAAGTGCAGGAIVITNSHDDPATARANMAREWNGLMGKVPA